MNPVRNPDQSSSHFLQLPPELRRIIIQYINPDCLFLKNFEDHRCKHPLLGVRERIPYPAVQIPDEYGEMMKNSTSLRRVNKRMNKEAGDLLFSKTELRVSCNREFGEAMAKQLPDVITVQRLLNWISQFQNLMLVMCLPIFEPVDFFIVDGVEILLQIINRTKRGLRTNLDMVLYQVPGDSTRPPNYMEDYIDIIQGVLRLLTKPGHPVSCVLLPHMLEGQEAAMQWRPPVDQWRGLWFQDFLAECYSKGVLVVKSGTTHFPRCPLLDIPKVETRFLRSFTRLCGTSDQFQRRWVSRRVRFNQPLPWYKAAATMNHIRLVRMGDDHSGIPYPHSLVLKGRQKTRWPLKSLISTKSRA